MNTSFAYAVAYIQIVFVYGLMPAFFLRFVAHLYAIRNPEWVAQHPDFIPGKSNWRVGRWLFYALGVAWIALLTQFQRDAAAERLLAALYYPTSLWLILAMGYIGLEYLCVGRHIPPATKRSARFARRTLRELVHPGWLIACYALYGALFAAYLALFKLGRIPDFIFEARIITIAFVMVLFTLILIWGVVRKNQPGDDIFWGPSSRKFEVRFFVGGLYFGLAMFATHLARDGFGLPALENVSLFVAVNLLTQAFFLTMIIKLRRAANMGTLSVPR